MANKAFLVLCAQALLIQSTVTQRVNRTPNSGPYGPMVSPFTPMASPFTPMASPFNPMASPLNPISSPLSQLANRNWPSKSLDSWPAKPLGCASPVIDITATSGGGLPVTSSSAIAPTGITVVSENAFEGPLVVAGEVPFVGTTAVDGILPTAGAGATNYGCGDGVTAMVSEEISPGLPAAAVFPAAALASSAVSPASALSPTSAGSFPAGRLGGCGRGVKY